MVDFVDIRALVMSWRLCITGAGVPDTVADAELAHNFARQGEGQSLMDLPQAALLWPAC